jgi:hypothetical protein
MYTHIHRQCQNISTNILLFARVTCRLTRRSVWAPLSTNKSKQRFTITVCVCTKLCGYGNNFRPMTLTWRANVYVYSVRVGQVFWNMFASYGPVHASQTVGHNATRRRDLLWWDGVVLKNNLKYSCTRAQFWQLRIWDLKPPFPEYAAAVGETFRDIFVDCTRTFYSLL